MNLQGDPFIEYTYQPLLESRLIRLCKLLPGSGSSELRCKLVVVSIDTDIARYIWSAVSYCWVTEYLPDRSFCLGFEDDDGHDSSYLKVSRTVLNMLKQIRDKDSHRFLWIDAICINQKDFAERNQQVKMMGDIYRRANEVILWLGPSDSRTEAVFAGYEVLARMRTPENLQGMDDMMSFRTSDLEEFERTEPVGGPSLTRDMLTLLDRPWFSRVWVLQEVGLASRVTVLCGSHITDWQTIGTCIMFWKQRDKTLVAYLGRSDIVNRAFHLFTSFRKQQTPGIHEFQFWWQKFLYVLDNARPYLATEPRDKVYALLAHKTALLENGAPFVEPDYSKPLAVVYREVTLRMIAASDSLEVLSAVQHDPHSKLRDDSEFPTWVPRWDRYYDCHMLGRYTSKHFAGGNSPACVIPTKDNNVLKVQGILFSRVRHLSNLMRSEDFNLPPMVTDPGRLNPVSATWIAWSLDKLNDNMYPQLAFPSDPSMWTAYTSTLTAGMTEPAAGYNMLEPLADANAYWAHLIQSLSHKNQGQANSTYRDHEALQEARRDGDWRRFREAAAGVSNMRRVCWTDNLYLGLCPAVTQRGDVVAVLSGSDTPTILRHRGGSRYQVVGECYVHGLMQGQARVALRNGSLLLEELELC